MFSALAGWIRVGQLFEEEASTPLVQAAAPSTSRLEMDKAPTAVTSSSNINVLLIIFMVIYQRTYVSRLHLTSFLFLRWQSIITPMKSDDSAFRS